MKKRKTEYTRTYCESLWDFLPPRDHYRYFAEIGVQLEQCDRLCVAEADLHVGAAAAVAEADLHVAAAVAVAEAASGVHR